MCKKDEIIKILEKGPVEIDFISHIPYMCTSTWRMNNHYSNSADVSSIIKIGDKSITAFNTKNPEINISSDLMKKIQQAIIDTIKNHE